MRIKPTSIGVIHFIGIGGIGMSGIAEVLFNLGYSIRGSDVSENANVNRLRELGVEIIVGHNKYNIEGASLVIVSSAIKQDNPEMLYAKELSIPIIHRSEMLAELMRLKPSVVVSGTHGKTTTTSLIAALLDESGFNPTVISGGIIESYGTNARVGSGEWMVVEADESDGSFIKLPSTIAIVTNIDYEHLDFYKSYDALKDSFLAFIKNIPFYGLGVLCIDNKNIKDLLCNFLGRRIITYGFDECADIRAVNVEVQADKVKFDIKFSENGLNWIKDNKSIEKHLNFKNVVIPMRGFHNVQNALASIAVAIELGGNNKSIVKALYNFSGISRRFTLVGRVNGVSIIDDYAHHPTEIKAVLHSASLSNKGKTIAVVQPHRYSRLKNLFNEFCSCFDYADAVIVTPVYSAGETPIVGINSRNFANNISKKYCKNIFMVDNIEQLRIIIDKITKSGDMVICLGAGDISSWAHKLFEDLLVLSKKRQINV